MKYRYFNISVLTLPLLFLFALSSPAYAFKLATHVWVAEQVWNDVSADGSVNIPPYGEIPVDPSLVTALRNHKSVFLSGSIGPDGFPDMIGGQMTTHPGTEGGWNSDDWASWLLQSLPSNAGTNRNKALAFTYGYFSHISADVFAHSYVNTYAGDTFELFDLETSVEARHMLIEGYIAEHTPITNPQDKIAITEQLPLDWLTSTIIMNPTVEHQYFINGNNGNATLHLYLMHEYRDKIQQLIELTESMQIPIDSLIYQLAEDIVENVPPEVLNITYATLSATDSICGAVFSSGGNEGLIGDLWNDIQDNINPIDLIAPGITIPGGGADNIQDMVEDFGDELGEQLNNLKDEVYDFVGDNPSVCLVNPGFCVANYSAIELTEAISDIPDIALCLAANPNICMHIWLAEEYCEVSGEVLEAQKEIVDQSIMLGAVLLMQNAYLGAIIHYLHEWKSSMYPAARSWTSTSSQVVHDVMSHKNPVPRVVDWLECWVYVYAGGTIHVQQACEMIGDIVDSLFDLQTAISNARGRLDQELLSLVGIDLLSIEQQINDDINRLRNRAEEFVVDKIMPPELKGVIDLTLNGVSPEALNEEFAIDNTQYTLNKKYLVEIPNMARRMDKEMNVIQINENSKHFSVNDFPPAYNAIILSKLALLNADQLNELAYRAGMNSDLYDPNLSNNVLINAIKSIDGNHQWLEQAPPHPRQGIAPDPESHDHSYGYSLTDTHGFRIYQNSEARGKIFNKIFIGLLAPGIEKPSLIGESEVLPSSYLYRPCSSVPYPNGPDDQSCAIEYLIPILMMLLN